jgi:hypothetical protein
MKSVHIGAGMDPFMVNPVKARFALFALALLGLLFLHKSYSRIEAPQYVHITSHHTATLLTLIVAMLTSR